MKEIGKSNGEPDGEGKDRLLSVRAEAEGRVFIIELLRLSNGCFVSISENPAPRMGAITLSIRSPDRSNSSTLIPDRRGSIFSGMIGELLAEKSGGVALVSLYLREELDSGGMKMLLNEVSRLLNRSGKESF